MPVVAEIITGFRCWLLQSENQFSNFFTFDFCHLISQIAVQGALVADLATLHKGCLTLISCRSAIDRQSRLLFAAPTVGTNKFPLIIASYVSGRKQPSCRAK